MVQFRIVSLFSFALANPAVASNTTSLLESVSPSSNDKGKVWKEESYPLEGGGSKKKTHVLDRGFSEYQLAMELVDKAVDGRSTVKELVLTLKQDIEFEKQNKAFKQDVVAMWSARIERSKKLFETTSARYDTKYAALETKRLQRTQERAALRALKNAASLQNTEKDIPKAEKQVSTIQKLQDTIDADQTSFRADKAERHAIKMNLKRCQLYKQEAEDAVAFHQKIIDDKIMEYTQNSAPAKLAVLASKDVERKARQNAGRVAGRLWSAWKKWRRADLKQKSDVQRGAQQAQSAAQQDHRAAAVDKKQAVNKAQARKMQAKDKAQSKVKKARNIVVDQSPP